MAHKTISSREDERQISKNFYSTTSQLDREIIKKLNNVKNETQKENLKKKMDFYNIENNYKSKLNDIMKKYKNTQKINFSTEINTKEFKTLLHTIDNIIKTNEQNDSNYGGIHIIIQDGNYFMTKINKTEVFQVKKRKNVNLLIKETILENFNEPFNTFYSSSNNLFQKGIQFIKQNQ